MASFIPIGLKRGLTPKLRGNDAKHYCPLERPVRLGRGGRVLHFRCEAGAKYAVNKCFNGCVAHILVGFLESAQDLSRCDRGDMLA
jgi:hypothetical protein